MKNMWTNVFVQGRVICVYMPVHLKEVGKIMLVKGSIVMNSENAQSRLLKINI